MVLAGILLGCGTVAAQSRRSIKAIGDREADKAIITLKAETQNRKAKDWCLNMFLLSYAHTEEREFPEAVAVLDDLIANADNPKCATSETLPAWHLLARSRGLFQ